jgi:hypothetical protein
MVRSCLQIVDPETADLLGVMKADARNRTGDPFITRKVHQRFKRTYAHTSGHESAAKAAFTSCTADTASQRSKPT